MIQPIVEGHGEIPAVPVLVRKLGELMGIPHVPVGTPFRSKRSQLVQKDGLQRVIGRAREEPGCRGILILFDADDDCPKEEAPQLLIWGQEAAAPLPCFLVMANREYEAWFLGSVEVLLQKRGIAPAQPYEKDPEAKRDARGEFESRFGRDFHYVEKQDQPAFTALADWALVHKRCRSFRKMANEARSLFVACGLSPAPWPLSIKSFFPVRNCVKAGRSIRASSPFTLKRSQRAPLRRITCNRKSFSRGTISPRRWLSIAGWCCAG